MEPKTLSKKAQSDSTADSQGIKNERLAEASNQWLMNGTVPSSYLDDVLGSQTTVITSERPVRT